MVYEICNNPCRGYAFIDQKRISIDNYISEKDGKYKDKMLFCKNNHPISFVNCEKRKKHFRHTNSNLETNMSDWHILWQEEFSLTEHTFKKKSEKQHRERRADVWLKDYNMVVEFQHSCIEIESVASRYNDYTEINGHSIIWIIDGNTEDIDYEKIDVIKGNIRTYGYLIKFKEKWKYESFISNYDFVLLDINNQLFKIAVKKVCAGMILVKEFRTREDVIQKLKCEPVNIWNLWNDDNEILPLLTIYQKGAGNGKTFGIWKSIIENKFKNTFIILTKQHSARTVIKEELVNQIKRSDKHILENVVEESDGEPGIEINELMKKYIIYFSKKNTNQKIKVIVGTVDSFIYAITNNKKSNTNVFNGMIQTIINSEECDKVTKKNYIRYAGFIELTRKTEIWIDETQDLNKEYYEAFTILMYKTNIDVVVVGDKLQSLEFEKNFITESVNEGCNKIDYYKPEALNVNRRIKTKDMDRKINEYIKFKEYGVKQIDVNDNLKGRNDIPIEPLCLEKIYANDSNDDKIAKAVDIIIDKVRYEVKTYNYKPHDFLFIFPIMKGNVLASVLETRLNDYWRNEVYKNIDEDYKSYVILHKHQDGKVIDTELSRESSRIMSIRSSKGDGREVVFVLNCTEQSLKLLSNHKINLIFESYFHVALTRSKSKIYFHLENNYDEIHKRFGSDGLIPYRPCIKTSLKLSTVIDYINKPKIIEILKKYDIKDYESTNEEQSINKTQIDWGFHCIRHSVYYHYALFYLFEYDKERNFHSSQIKQILEEVKELAIVSRSPKEFYLDMTKCGKDLIEKKFEYFPLCNLSHKPIYKTYYNSIKCTMEKIKNHIQSKKINLSELDVKDMVVLNYMIEILSHGYYHETSPRELYDIIHCLENNSNKLKDIFEESKEIKKIVKDVINNITKNNSNIEWNIEHMIKFHGKNDDFKIRMNVPFIGYDSDRVYHFMIQTDYSELNHWDTMISILMERFLIRHPNINDKSKNNFTRYSDKKIITYLLILNKSKFKVFDWDWDKNDDKCLIELKNICVEGIHNNLKSNHKSLFKYYGYIKKDFRNDNDKYIKEGIETPMGQIYKDYYNVEYIKNYFKFLEQKWNDEDEEARFYIKDQTDNENKFVTKLDQKLKESLNKYFGLKTNIRDLDF